MCSPGIRPERALCRCEWTGVSLLRLLGLLLSEDQGPRLRDALPGSRVAVLAGTSPGRAVGRFHRLAAVVPLGARRADHSRPLITLISPVSAVGVVCHRRSFSRR